VPTRNSSQGGSLKAEVAGNSYEDFMKKKRADDANFQKEFPVQLPDTFKGGSSENSPKSKAARKEAEALRDSLIAQGYNAAVKHTTSSYAAYGKGTVTTSSFKVFRSEAKGQSLKSDLKPRKNELNTKVDGGFVETWYDKEIRSWVTQIKDAEGNQVGPSEFTARGKASAKNAHDFAVGEASRRLNR